MFGASMLPALGRVTIRRVRVSVRAIALLLAMVAMPNTAVAADTQLLNTDQQAMGFTGYVKDAESGLYYANARYYDPRIARFATQDPEEGNAMQPPSLHRYLYAYANPTAYIDPTGREQLSAQTQRLIRLAHETDPERAAQLREKIRVEDIRGDARFRATFEDFRDTGIGLYQLGKNILKAGYESSLLGYATGAGSEGVDALASGGKRFVNKVAHPIDNIYVPIRQDFAKADELDAQGKTYEAEYVRHKATLETENVLLTATAAAGLVKSGTKSLARAFAEASPTKASVLTEGGLTSVLRPGDQFFDDAAVADLDDAYRPAGQANEPAQVRVNQHEGARRESETLAELRAKYPNANIQQQVYLRTTDGKAAIDPLTGEWRRVDFVVIQDGKVVDVVETTSMSARKTEQALKKRRIRGSGAHLSVIEPTTASQTLVTSLQERIVGNDAETLCHLPRVLANEAAWSRL